MATVAETKLNRIFLTEREGRVLVVIPHGDSVGYKNEDIPREIARVEQAIENNEVEHLVFDLGQSSYFGTVVIGAMHALTKVVERHDGQAVLCKVSEDMSRILSAMNLDTIWMAFDTRKVALKALAR